MPPVGRDAFARISKNPDFHVKTTPPPLQLAAGARSSPGDLPTTAPQYLPPNATIGKNLRIQESNFQEDRYKAVIVITINDGP
jgi:hypothetical protein